MSIVKRFNRLLGLEKIDVLVDDKDKSRHIVIQEEIVFMLSPYLTT